MNYHTEDLTACYNVVKRPVITLPLVTEEEIVDIARQLAAEAYRNGELSREKLKGKPRLASVTAAPYEQFLDDSVWQNTHYL